VTSGRGALAVAAAAAVLSGSLTAPSLSAQAPIQAEAGVRIQGGQVGYATSEQLMAIDARMAMEASAGLAAADGSSAGRRRFVKRPAFESQRAAALQASSAATEPEINASEPAAFNQAYIGAALSDTGSLPPDPSGGAGPAQFILAANGRIRSFSKITGAPDLVLNVSTNAFFSPVRNSPNAFSPKIKYDRLAGRWFIVAATDAMPGRIVIASSNASTITASTLWSFFAFDNTGFPGAGTCAVDSPTFGLDPAALYIGVVQFCDPGGVYIGTSGFVVRKTSVIDFATIAVTAFHNLTGSSAGAGPFAPQGVDNEDPGITTGYFVGVDNASLGTLMLRRISNPGTTPTISGNLSLAVPATAAPITVRHLGNIGSTNGQLDGGDDRLTSAMLRNGTLWTAQTIGVNESGAASASATRNGVRWYQIGSVTGTPTLLQSGTLFTSGSAGSVNVRNYWVPSIATSPAGRTIIGYSAAGTNEYVNAGVAERFAADTPNTLRAPHLFTSSAAAYNPPSDPGSPTRGRRWGGNSSTVVDGCDGATIWTLQQFTDAANSYALAVGRTVGPGPATPVSVTPSTIASGVASIDLQVTATSSGGTAFFDGGASYLCRISGAIPGVTVNSVTLLSPTSVRFNVSTVNATPGLKPITVFNPDTQGVQSAPILRVTPGPFISIDAPVAGAAGQPVTVRGWAVDGNATSGTGVDAVHIYAQPQGGNPILLGAATYGQARSDVAAAHGSRFTNSGYTLTAATTLPPGPYTIIAYAHSTATGTFNATATVAVTLLGPTAPWGSLDTPADNATVTGEIGVTGWALDDVTGTRVEIYRAAVAGEAGGLVYIGRAVFIRGARPDVQAAYPNAADSDTAGWGLMVLTNFLPNQGNGTFTLYAYAIDAGGLQTLLGTRRITAANASSARPFGTIDTPAQGQTVSGVITNFGWALTPQPNIIPTNGSTIDVYVDGVFVGHPTYNQYRADIATMFPGLRNTAGAVGFISIDTTTLSNGLHTIQWVVTDSAGQASGMGSRFFRVQNGS
jgi:hypothetical protein